MGRRGNSSWLLVLRLQNHDADAIPRRVTESAWRKVHEGYGAQAAGVEPEVIEEKLAGYSCAAARERELIGWAFCLGISFNDDRAVDNRLAVLREGVFQ